MSEELFTPELETRTIVHKRPEQNVQQDGVVPQTEEKEVSGEDPELQKWLQKDPETVAKAKVNSDRYIKQLQEENAGMRQQIATSLSLEDFLERQKERQGTNVSTQGRTEGSPNSQYDAEGAEEGMGKTNNSNPGDKVDLSTEVKNILEQELSTREATERESRNLNYVKTRATEALGPEYPFLFSQKAKELGVDTSYLNDMAKNQPDAFLGLMLGQDYKKAEVGAPPVGSVSGENRSALTPSRKKGTHISDWDDIKKSDPRLYWSPKIQNEIHKAGQEVGPDFFSRN